MNIYLQLYILFCLVWGIYAVYKHLTLDKYDNKKWHISWIYNTLFPFIIIPMGFYKSIKRIYKRNNNGSN